MFVTIFQNRTKRSNKFFVRKNISSQAITSLVNLYQILVIILFIKYELFNKQHVSTAKAKALIYNKDGKFIYRPAKANQGHIIVIDDRHNNNNHDDHKSDSDNHHNHHHDYPPPPAYQAAATAAYHPIQLISPPRYHYHPATGTATSAATYYPSSTAAAAATSSGSTVPSQQVQLISLAELPTISHPLSSAASSINPTSSGYRSAYYHHHQPTSISSNAPPAIQIMPLIQLYATRPQHHQSSSIANELSTLQLQQQDAQQRKPTIAYGTNGYLPTAVIQPSTLSSEQYPTALNAMSLQGGQQQQSQPQSLPAGPPALDNSALAQYAAAQQQQQQLLLNNNYSPQFLIGRQSRNYDLENNLDLSSLQASAAFQDDPLPISQRLSVGGGQRQMQLGSRLMMDNFDNHQNEDGFLLAAQQQNHHHHHQSNNDIFDDNHPQQHQLTNNNHSPSRNGYQHNGKVSFDTSIPGFIPPPPPQSSLLHNSGGRSASKDVGDVDSQYRNGNNDSGYNNHQANDGNLRASSTEQEHKKLSTKFMKRIRHSQNYNNNGKQKSVDFLSKRFPLDSSLQQQSATTFDPTTIENNNTKQQLKGSNYWKQFRDQYDIIS